jgi:hypothetical protein
MDTPRPGDKPPPSARQRHPAPPAAEVRPTAENAAAGRHHAAAGPQATGGRAALQAVLPLLLVAAASYFLYRVSPVWLLLAGAAALGWLVWALAQTLLRHTGPAWLPQAVAGVIWLVYAMRLVHGWREEIGYAASLWHVFGWTFLSTLFWGLLLMGAVRFLEKWNRP